MDRKFKLLAASSVVVALASGCTPYNARTGTYDNTEYGSGASQGASQNESSPPTETCAPCKANNRTAGEHNQKWYVDRWNRQQQAQQNQPRYTPPNTIYRPPVPTKGEHSQQWYIDRWNRQQQAQQNKPRYTPPKPYKPAPKPYTPPKKTYSGYGGAKKETPTNYYDYSAAGGYSSSNKSIYTGASTKNTSTNKSIYTGASTKSTTKNSAPNKSIYTGNYSTNTYQPYSPKTYTSGVNSSKSNSSNNSYNANSYDTYTSGGSDTYVAPSSSSSSSSYSGCEVATGSYKTGDKTYTVQRKDTVFSVMRLTGVYWKEIIKMNNLTPPYTISPGQSLRLK
jgi:hypothetical protein